MKPGRPTRGKRVRWQLPSPPDNALSAALCGCSPGAVVEPRRANLRAPVLTGPGCNSRPARHRNGRFAGSSGGKRRPEPHGHRSLRPSFSTSSVSMPTMRLPRLTRDSLEGTPGGACWRAQKDASASWSRYMMVLPRCGEQEDRSHRAAAAASCFVPARRRPAARCRRLRE